jgi:CheY-like chemotaxis protein
MQPRQTRLASATINRMLASGFATRILIVDHDRQVGVTLSFMLAARRFDEVRAVRSAGRAMAITEQFRPEIVFLDLDLPEDGTMAVARKLVHDAHRPRPRLIALSRDAEPAAREKARAAGFERCIGKPVSHDELDKVLGTDSRPRDLEST